MSIASLTGSIKELAPLGSLPGSMQLRPCGGGVAPLEILKGVSGVRSDFRAFYYRDRLVRLVWEYFVLSA